MAYRNVKSRQVDDYVYRNKMWKENPPGPEQLELNKLFNNQIITENDTANDVRLKYPIFRGFSSRVFAAHFRKTKSKFGLMLNTESSIKYDGGIPELGGGIDPQSDSNQHSTIEVVNQSNNSVEFTNPPVAVWEWMDHGRKSKFVTVAMPIFGGSNNIDFEVAKDGKSFTLNFLWPSAIFRPKALFEDDIKNNIMDENHPQIHALTSQLLSNGITDKSRPKGNIAIDLPIQVQRDDSTWTFRAIKKEDGSRIALIELKGYPEDAHLQDANRTLSFAD